jgi:hypothetical protein
MKIDDFAQKHRLKVRRDECQEQIIMGRFGHISEHSRGLFDLVLEALPSSNELDRRMRHRRRQAIAAGFELHQEGDVEAILLFDPTNQEHSNLAIRLAGVRPKRIPSVRQLDVLRKARQNRQPHCAQATIAT